MKIGLDWNRTRGVVFAMLGCAFSATLALPTAYGSARDCSQRYYAEVLQIQKVFVENNYVVDSRIRDLIDKRVPIPQPRGVGTAFGVGATVGIWGALAALTIPFPYIGLPALIAGGLGATAGTAGAIAAGKVINADELQRVDFLAEQARAYNEDLNRKMDQWSLKRPTSEDQMILVDRYNTYMLLLDARRWQRGEGNVPLLKAAYEDIVVQTPKRFLKGIDFRRFASATASVASNTQFCLSVDDRPLPSYLEIGIWVGSLMNSSQGPKLQKILNQKL
jgi:hypothetical protein